MTMFLVLGCWFQSGGCGTWRRRPTVLFIKGYCQRQGFCCPCVLRMAGSWLLIHYPPSWWMCDIWCAFMLAAEHLNAAGVSCDPCLAVRTQSLRTSSESMDQLTLWVSKVGYLRSVPSFLVNSKIIWPIFAFLLYFHFSQMFFFFFIFSNGLFLRLRNNNNSNLTTAVWPSVGFEGVVHAATWYSFIDLDCI